MSETTTPAVYAAICAVQKELARVGISKDRENAQQKYKFRGIDDCYNALSSLLAENNLCILPRALSRTMTERKSQSGGALFSVVLDVEFDFVSAVDASKHTVKMFGEAMDSGDKASNKAASAAYKYAVIQAFSIPTEGDNDADATTHEVAPQKQEPAKPRNSNGTERPTADADRLHKAAQKFTAALDAAGATKDHSEALAHRGECAGILSYAATPKGLPAGPRRVLQQHAVKAIIERLGKNSEAPELGRELHGMGLITDDDWCNIQAAMNADLPTGATT